MPDWNKAFNSVCRIVLKEELGTLQDYATYLHRYLEPIQSTRSYVSDKQVYYSMPYASGSKILSFEEALSRKAEPINLNEMKDIDSLLTAVQERFEYGGNKVLGNSEDVVESDNIMDGVHIYRSNDVLNAENIAYSQMLIRGSKFAFGCSWSDRVSFSINCSELSMVTRSFESGFMVNTSDAYFSYNCIDCNDVIFCFNQRAKRHAIGNTVLGRDTYNALKKKLLEEVVQQLKKEKTFPSLVELCFGGWK
ncbi:hypothetical protein HZC07_01220 [Candidatus Micrarchaeota archaeon]|nr:hypothetical protein [Candidatus Micrarchaeota archaeon]